MDMKTLLFFSRCELTDLYGNLHKQLVRQYNIIHVAYSSVEADILTNKYQISEVIIFKDYFAEIRKELSVTTLICKEIDEIIIKETSGRFNLNGSISSDRTFKNMSYDDAIFLTILYFKTWQRIFQNQKVDFFIHEPTSLMLNHSASILCKQQGGVYSTHIMVQGKSDFNFIMVDHDCGFPTELKSIYNSTESNEFRKENSSINEYLTKFRASYNVFFDVIGSKSNFRFYYLLTRNALKEQVLKWFSNKKFDQTIDNIEYFLFNDFLNLRRLKNLISYRKIKYDKYCNKENFYFYPFHLEPEAVVLYWADGLYTNQIKLIENIAAQLPPNIFLYVKDHPHLYGYRNLSDYANLQKIPNVKLLAPQIPGKKIVKDSLGVITLNGTAGLEALLLNKHIITFGSAFYNVSKRVKFVKNIKDFRDVVYNLRNVIYEDDDELYRFVFSFIKSQKEGFTDFYGNVANSINLDKDNNMIHVAKGLDVFFKNHQNYSNGI